MPNDVMNITQDRDCDVFDAFHMPGIYDDTLNNKMEGATAPCDGETDFDTIYCIRGKEEMMTVAACFYTMTEHVHLLSHGRCEDRDFQMNNSFDIYLITFLFRCVDNKVIIHIQLGCSLLTLEPLRTCLRTCLTTAFKSCSLSDKISDYKSNLHFSCKLKLFLNKHLCKCIIWRYVHFKQSLVCSKLQDKGF